MAGSRLDQITAADLPQRLGRYGLQSILGEGGMARVFRAELHGPAGFRKQVAVKVIVFASELCIDEFTDPTGCVDTTEPALGG